MMETDNVVAVAEVIESPDGHVTEVIVTKADDLAATDEAHSPDEVIEAMLEAVGAPDADEAGAEVHEYVIVDEATGEEAHVEVIEYDAADATTDADSAFDHDGVDTVDTIDTDNAPVEYDAAADGGMTETSATAAVETTDGSAHTSVESEADTATDTHAAAATDIQSEADAAVDAGNYEAAAQLRENAENEAWAAGDSSMLHGSTSSELDSAADHQAQADYYEQQEAQHAAAGDYEAAREDAANAAYETGWADYQGGGADHSGQAEAEYAKEDWAVWEQHNADSAQQDAEWYAAHGDADMAAEAADSAAAHQDQADTFGHEGEHSAIDAVHDPSSDVDHSSVDAYDSHVDASASYATDHSYDDAGTTAE